METKMTNSTKFDTNLIVKAAKNIGLENVVCYADQNSVSLSTFYMPPNEHRISSRQFTETVKISNEGQVCKIEVHGWRSNQEPFTTRLKKEKICDGQLDKFFVESLNNPDVTIWQCIQQKLYPSYMHFGG